MRSAAECSSQSPTGRNTAPTAPPEFTGGRKQKVNGKGGLLWTVRQAKKSLIYKALQAQNRGGQYKVSSAPGKRASNRPQNTTMTNTIYIHQPEKAVSFTRLPNFLFEAPTFTPLSNEAKVLYAFILRRTDLSRKNGWADEYGRIYLYYPINEVVELLHCGRQKAVNTLRELQYAGLVEIQKQGCGKPNRIYPKSYEAVSNTDFKKSGYGTPED